jgi:hypothetical protein
MPRRGGGGSHHTAVMILSVMFDGDLPDLAYDKLVYQAKKSLTRTVMYLRPGRDGGSISSVSLPTKEMNGQTQVPSAIVDVEPRRVTAFVDKLSICPRNAAKTDTRARRGQ